MRLEDMVNRYIVTAAQFGAPVNHKQLDAYEQYAKRWDAQILVIPIQGQFKDAPMHDRIADYVSTSDMDLNDNVAIRDFNIKAQQINPLTGLKRFGAVDKSIIIGSPKQHLEYVANSPRNKPKAVMSTGVCTKPMYKSDTRIGRIAEEDHRQGAILVEAENDGTFHFRQVQNTNSGSFMDLGIKYYPDKKPEFVGVDTLVWGDLHDAQKDPVDYQTSLEMLDDLQPKNLILHDVFDAYSVTHHDINRHILRANKHGLGYLSLSDELSNLGETLREICEHGRSDMQIYIVKSNHDEHLEKYLDQCRYVGDAENMALSVRLANAMLEGDDPVEQGIKMMDWTLPKRIHFLQRDDELQRYGFELGFHGDKGVSGGRGSLPSYDYALGKAVVGHNHTPAIRKNIYRMGTLLRKDVDYAKGSPGSWSSTHAAIHPDGKAQLINIHNGEWTK